MALSNAERRTLAAIEDEFVRTRRAGLLKPWPGTGWHVLLRVRAVLPLLAVLVSCAGAVVLSALTLPAAVAAVVGAAAGAVAVQLGGRYRRNSRPTRT